MSGLRNDYEAAAVREVARWAGVSARFEDNARHPRIVLSFSGAERFVVYPASPSDSRRGLARFLADVRRTLRDLGAEREKPAASTRPRKARSRGPDPKPPEITDPRPDGFAALKALAARAKRGPAR